MASNVPNFQAEIKELTEDFKRIYQDETNYDYELKNVQQENEN